MSLWAERVRWMVAGMAIVGATWAFVHALTIPTTTHPAIQPCSSYDAAREAP